VAAPTWESLADRQIREAQERGEFADLPYHGKPLPNADDTYAGEMAMAFRILRNHGAAPPWIEADKDARRLLGERDALLEHARRASVLSHRRYRDELSRIVRAYNDAVAVLAVEAPSYRQHRSRMNESRELAALEALWSHDAEHAAHRPGDVRDPRGSEARS
jgi:hypothetical protein